MRYLLVGNGDVEPKTFTAAVTKADVIVQLNKCRHFAATTPHNTRYIIITNTGAEVPDIVNHLLSLRDRPELKQTRIILARNPTYYLTKMWFLKLKRRLFAQYFQPSKSWMLLKPSWEVSTVSFLSALGLDVTLVRLGMPPSWMPSAGLIAYSWLRKRLRKCDTLEIQGFTFEGWQLHPWSIERQIVTNISGGRHE